MPRKMNNEENRIRIEEQDQQIDALVQKVTWLKTHVPGVWFEASLSGTIIDIAPSISQISSYAPDTLKGRSLWNLYPNPLQREELLSLIAEQQEVSAHPVDLLDHDGATVHVLVTAMFVMNAQGLPYRIFGYVARA